MFRASYALVYARVGSLDPNVGEDRIGSCSFLLSFLFSLEKGKGWGEFENLRLFER